MKSQKLSEQVTKELRYVNRLAAVAAVLAISGTAMAADTGVISPPDMTATLLVVVGVILLMLEIKILSQGILGLFAAVCLVGASIIIWRDGDSFWGIPVTWVVPVIALILTLGIILTVLSLKAYKVKVASGYESFAGEEAEAYETLDPSGRVFFRGTYWRAESLAPVRKGQKVRILSADRLKLMVEPWTSEDSNSQAKRKAI